MSTTDYAGFWLRFVAFVIDAIVLSVFYLLVILPLYTFLGPAHPNMEEVPPDPSGIVEQTGRIQYIQSMVDFSQLILFVVAFFYYVYMESSRYQATFGKLALELKVTDENGYPLNFIKALIRNASKIISTLTFFIGYIMAAFTKRKQALHDRIAKAIVIKK